MSSVLNRLWPNRKLRHSVPVLYLNCSSWFPPCLFQFSEPTSNLSGDSGSTARINSSIHPRISMVTNQNITIRLHAAIHRANHVEDRLDLIISVYVDWHCYVAFCKVGPQTIGNVKRAPPFFWRFRSWNKQEAEMLLLISWLFTLITSCK